MEYSKVKDALYQSEAIQDIPDKWEKSIPFKCSIQGKTYDSFLYWIASSNQAEIKRMICIDCETGVIRTFSPDEIVECFGISNLIFNVIPITDYDTYFRAKEEYDIFYSSLCGNIAEQIDYSKGLVLIKTILGEDCLNKIMSVLAIKYISDLSSGNL